MLRISRWRRARLSALAAFCLLLLTAGTASAALEGSTTITPDSDAHWWNTPNVVSNGTYQWIAYWDAQEAGGEIHAQVSRRRLSDGRVDTVRFDGTRGTTSMGLNNINDAHDYLQLGISPNDGRLHISWSDHHERHYYARSAERCLTQATFSQETCRFDWSALQTPEVRDRETGGSTVEIEKEFTYPFYFNDSRGRLYMSYRFGSSSRGDFYINRYEEATGRWRNRGKIMWGRASARIRFRSPVPAVYDPAPGRAATEETSEERGPYIWGWEFDKNDRLQISWVWREHLVRNVDYFHDYYYAFSDDYGETWHRTNADSRRDTPIATAETDPITINDSSALVLSAPPGSMPGGARMAFDSDNRPHLVFSMNEGEVVNDQVDTQTRLRHLWLGTDGRWYSTWIGTADQQGAWGELVIDGADNLNFIYNRNIFDWIPIWEYPWTQLWLSSDLVTWQSDGERRGHLNVVQKSEITCLDTRERVGTTIESRGNSQLRVNVQNRTDAREMQLWFTTVGSKEWTVEKTATTRVTENEAGYREATFDMSRNAAWTGTLRRLEVCMLDSRADAGDEFNLDWVRVTNAEGRTAKGWEFDETGSQLYIATVSSANNWGGEWSIGSLLPEVSDTWSDNGFIVDRPRYRETGKVTFPMLTQGAPGTESMALREYRVTGDTIRKQWPFDVSATEWTAVEDVEGLRWAEASRVGVVEGRIIDNDSAIDSPANVGVRLSARRIDVTMKQSAGRQAMLCWTTTASRTWSLNRCTRFTVRDDNAYHTYEVRNESREPWGAEKTLYQLRVEPSDEATVRSGTFAIDSIKLID